MIELYVLLTLGAIGYMINQSSIGFKKVPNVPKLHKGEIPSYENIYESKRFETVKRNEEAKATKMFNDSQNPITTKVVPRIKSLSGDYINPSEFRHNNMKPYFGRSVKQNMTDEANATVIENFTGIGDLQTNKCEAPSFFDVSPEMGNVFGIQNQNDTIRDRFQESRMRQNELPFEKTYVGPGLGKEFSATPKGGFQQFETQDYIRPKTVDELRVITKPKVIGEGRIVEGLKTGMPSTKENLGLVEKNRADTFFEQGEDRWFVTTGAYLKDTDKPEYLMRDVNRPETSTSYQGVAVRAEGKEGVIAGSVRAPLKEQFGELGLTNPTMVYKKKGISDDYGKSTILVYNNERQVTGVKVQQGNLTTMVKSIVAPLLDVVKITKKDGFVDNPRHFGNAAPQVPDKLTVYDPNDIARTTIKETLIHDDTFAGTIKGPIQVAVYDADEIAAKTTGRETMRRMSYEMNLAGGAKKATVHDPDDLAKSTMKETTIDTERDGYVERQGGGAFETTEYSAPNTAKQFTSLHDYYGSVTRDKGQGYATNAADVPNTQKQYVSDYEYYGGGEAEHKKPMAKEHIANARVNVSQEMLLHNRPPTNTGAKVYTTADNINMEIRKDTLAPIAELANRERVVQYTLPKEEAVVITRGRKEVEHEDDRLDPSILSSLSTNPYSLSLNK